MTVHRWRAVIDFYATADKRPEDIAGWLRAVVTHTFPLGVIEGYPDVWDTEDRIEMVRRERRYRDNESALRASAVSVRDTATGGVQAPEPVIVQDAWEGVTYIPGHDREEAWYVDDPETLEIEEIWMRAVPPPPPGERGDLEDLAVIRDARGRFKRVWWWEECHEKSAGAQPYISVKYRPGCP